MEAPINDLMESNTDKDNAIGSSTEKPSIVEYDSDSPQSTRSESRIRNVSQELEIVELSSDDEVQIVDVKGQKGEKTSEHGRDKDSAGRTSPQDVTCSVCLSEYDNKSFLDKCFHAFCYFCILQWSEIVRTCPLCKSSFTSIIHSVKSIDNYQQHYLSKPETPILQQQPQSDGRRFRYRTTLADGNQRHQRQQQQANETDPWGQRERRRQVHIAAQRDRKAIAREKRRTIYSNNLWVQGVSQEGRPRQREISPEFFRTNPACSHRLIPWLTRDLRVLLNDVESHVNFVLQIILSLITKVELNSEEFLHQLQPFLFDNTEHFIHEFISFTRSPFDVNAYDERAQYNWPNESREQVRETPTVFHSQSSGWQTPVPGPSGESMLQIDWGGDSPVVQREQTSWSPSSSPGTSGLNLQPSVEEIVTISSGSSHAVLTTNAEQPGSDEPTNASSHSKRPRSRSRSISETVTKEKREESRGKHKHSHCHHRHSHKHKHKHKRKHKKEDSKRHKATSGEQSEEVNSLNNDFDQANGSKSVFVDSSESDTPPVEVIVVDSDSSSPDLPKASRVDAAMLQRKAKRAASRSPSRSRSISKGKMVLYGGNRWQSRSGNTKSRSSRDRSRTTQDQMRKDNHRSRSRSRSRLKESHHSKEERRLEIEDRDISNSELFSSRKKALKKEKSHRGNKRSRSRSRSRSHSRSNTKSDSKTRSEKLDKRKTKVYSGARSTSESSMKDEAPSSSQNSRSRYSRSRRSRSRNSRSRNTRSRSQSRSKRFSRSQSPRNHAESSRVSRCLHSTDHSEPDTRESISHSNEDIKKEIEDLEVRINTDKKRLLKLLIKQERAKAADVTELTENELGVGNDCQPESK